MWSRVGRVLGRKVGQRMCWGRVGRMWDRAGGVGIG